MTRILTFVPVDRDLINKELDQEIADRDRADDLAKMADDVLADLEVDRLIDGDIEP